MKTMLLTFLFLSPLFSEMTTGKIIDAEGNPISGAIVSHENSLTYSSIDGTFKLSTYGKGTLMIEHIGYKTVLISHKNYLRIVMERSPIVSESIIVESQLNRTPLKNINASTSIIDQNIININQGAHLQLFLSNISNLNWSGGTSRPRYFQIRGIGERSLYTGEGAPNFSVGFSIDDIDFSGIGMGAMMFDMMQVEVFKGSQSSVFGANALAGLISMKSQNPTPFLGGHSIFTVGSDNNLQVGIALNTPITPRFLIRTSMFASAEDGFRKNRFLDKNNTNSKSETMFRSKLKLEISKNMNVDVTIIHSKMDNKYDAWSPDNNEQFYTYTDRQGWDSQESTALSIKTSYINERGYKVLSFTSKSKNDMEHSYDGDWGNNAFWEEDPYNWDSYYYGYEYRYDFFDQTIRNREVSTQEIRLMSPEIGKKKNSYIAGIYYRNLFESDSMIGWIFDGDVDLYDGYFDMNNIASYLKLNLNVSDNLQAEVSGRAEMTSLDYHADNFKDSDYDGIHETNYQISLDNKDNFLIGFKGTVAYNLSQYSRIFGSVSRGYKDGGINQNPFISDDNRYYNPEYNVSMEMGCKSFKNTSSFQLTLFYMLRQDLQVSVSAQQEPGNPNSFYYFTSNASSGYNYGLEIENSYSLLSEKIELSSSIGYLETWIEKYEFYTAENTSITLGDRAQAQAPELNLSLKAHLKPTKTIALIANYSYKSDYYFSDSHDMKSNDYSMLDLSLNYDIKSTSVSLWVRNALDTRYAVRGFYFGLEPPDYEDKLYIQWGDPLSFGVTTKYEF